MLYCAGNLTRTQATGAGVNTLRGTVYDRLDTLDVRLPGTVGTTMGVRHANAESKIFSAKIAFCHLTAPPFVYRYRITVLF